MLVGLASWRGSVHAPMQIQGLGDMHFEVSAVRELCCCQGCVEIRRY